MVSRSSRQLAALGLSAVVGVSAPALAQEDFKRSVTIDGHKAQVWASSTSFSHDDSTRYLPQNAFDGKPETAWVEGSDGSGDGETLNIEFDKPVAVRGFALYPGYLRSYKTLYQNTFPAAVDLTAGPKGETSLKDVRLYYVKYAGFQDPLAGLVLCHSLLDAPGNFGPRVVVFSRPWTERTYQLKVTISSFDPRNRYTDLGISEWRPILDEGQDHWSSDPAVKAASRLLRLIAEGTTIKGSEWLAPEGKVTAVTDFQERDWNTRATTRAVEEIRKYLAQHASKEAGADALQAYLAATHDLWVPLRTKSGPAAMGNFAKDRDGTYLMVLGQPLMFGVQDSEGAVVPVLYFDKKGKLAAATFANNAVLGPRCGAMLPEM